uniref:Retrovirus-related Pol polyprotein from transposon TNT 1-94 n=1 Tax=Cajanus cajan TaxID=3821 RepID=A0A151RZR1_CAJCA|nr:Retrovirus-related Pol polyprotein from transposon TNT 1-94 [Cajanus cajan]
MANPGKPHWEAIKWVLRYLCGTTDVGLKYISQGGVPEIEGFVDSDFAGSIDTRKSITGYVFKVFGNTVSWKANLQGVVALSSTEAEYMAACEAVKEALWLRGLVSELLLGEELETTSIYCDNQSAICLTKNQVHHERTKHVDVKFHFVRDVVASDVVKIEKVATEENAADMLTKALPSNKFEFCLKLLNVTDTG